MKDQKKQQLINLGVTGMLDDLKASMSSVVAATSEGKDQNIQGPKVLVKEVEMNERGPTL